MTFVLPIADFRLTMAGHDLRGDIFAAIAEAVEDPERTWLGPGVDLSPGAEDCARMLFDVLRRVHRWT